MNEREAYIGFATMLGIGPQRFKLLVEYFGSAVAAWHASETKLAQIGIGNKLLAKFLNHRHSFDPQKYELQLLAQEIKIITRVDQNYPKLLKEIPDPPIALFIKGNLLNQTDKVLAVVGTRKPTTYGKQITQQLVNDLTLQDFVIVSGMARGVDGIAHRTALDNGGRTIAVLGCGVDIIYPPEHKPLYQEIIQNGGAVISEVTPGHTVLKGLFPARNRIISGLSRGVLITEGAQDSGSLITARYAAEQGREVFAVPGPITSYLSAGPTKLIKQGAKLVTSVEDILEELNIKLKIKNEKLKISAKNFKLNKQEEIIIQTLDGGEKHYDEIVRSSGLAAALVGTLLTQLELVGIISTSDNGKYYLR